MKFRIAIFASGNGTNAVNFIHYFKDHPHIEIAGVFSNNPEAGVLRKSRELGVDVLLFNKDELVRGEVSHQLIRQEVNYVVLAGFLWLIPLNMIAAFPNRIVNIHPALLPKYGGKGMYGERVHKSVIDSGDSFSGITIHLVDEHYDNGTFLFQAQAKVHAGDTAETLALKIHKLEHQHYPKVVENLVLKGLKN